jgi:hypothetical protein
MRPTWKFPAGLILGFVLSFVVLTAIFYYQLGIPSDSSRWTAEVTKKKLALAEQTPSPKLLLVGGSSTLFGLNAKEIQAQTGVRTINLGTHAGMGPDYLLYHARQVAKPGDTVLLVLEYELYYYGKLEPAWADIVVLDYLLARDPEYFNQLTPMEKWNAIMLTPGKRLMAGFKKRRREGSRPIERPLTEANIFHRVYSVGYLNECGDQTRHTSAVRPVSLELLAQSGSKLGQELPKNPKGFGVIESFCRWARTNQVLVLATFPSCYDRPEYHRPAARHFVERLTEFYCQMNVPVIGQYTDGLYPVDDLFDTGYHLTETAALRRTDKLLKQLAPYLQQTNRVAQAR